MEITTANTYKHISVDYQSTWVIGNIKVFVQNTSVTAHIPLHLTLVFRFVPAHEREIPLEIVY